MEVKRCVCEWMCDREVWCLSRDTGQLRLC